MKKKQNIISLVNMGITKDFKRQEDIVSCIFRNNEFTTSIQLQKRNFFSVFKEVNSFDSFYIINHRSRVIHYFGNFTPISGYKCIRLKGF